MIESCSSIFYPPPVFLLIKGEERAVGYISTFFRSSDCGLIFIFFYIGRGKEIHGGCLWGIIGEAIEE
jgi:hypothetical protein